jgi:hypothetical protein
MRGQWWRHGGRSAPELPTPTLDDILDEVRDLRLTLATDLTAAAGAVDAGATDVAADIVEADRRELLRFSALIENRLRRSEPQLSTPAARRRRRAAMLVPALPLVGAMAVTAAAATGSLPLVHHGPAAKPPAVLSGRTPLVSTFQQFESVVENHADASQVVAAADALHQQIAALISSAPNNSQNTSEVIALLQLEQQLLMRQQPPGARIVLAASQQLAAQLLRLAPSVAPSLSAHHVLPTTVAVTPTPTPTTTKASPKPSPTRTTTSSPKPKASTSSSPSPTSKPSSGQTPPLPTVPH